MKQVFEYYLSAFSNSFNYRDAAKRSELNYFILIFSVIYFILFIIGFFCATMTLIFKTEETAPTAIIILFGTVIFYCLIHILPFISLVYRRIKDIFSDKSKLVFGIYLTVWGFQIAGVITNFVMALSTISIKQPEPSFLILMFTISVFTQICGLGMFGFLIYLMCKKGNL